MEFDVSIIIPAFNVGDYIAAAMESVLRQVPAFRQIIVIDDGSTDGTGDVVRAFDDPRIVYRYQENQGLGPARNAGIALAEGRFLYFMDADDLLEEGMTRQLREWLCPSRPVPDAVFFSAVDFDDRSGLTLPSSSYFKWPSEGLFASGRSALLASVAKTSVPACVFLCVFRRELIEGDRHLRFMNMLHEDEIFTPSLLLNCAGSVRISNAVLYRRRVRPASIMTSRASSRNVTGSLAVAAWWQWRAEASHERESARAYRRQAMRFYGMAIVYAARAGLRMAEVQTLVAASVPAQVRWVAVDRSIAGLSRKVAFAFVRARFRLGTFLQDRSTAKPGAG